MFSPFRPKNLTKVFPWIEKKVKSDRFSVKLNPLQGKDIRANREAGTGNIK